MAHAKNIVPKTLATEVDDPHPGSVSDGTHPVAAEHKPPRPGKPPAKSRQQKPASLPLKEGKTRVNTEAPRHPTKSASAS